MWLHRRSENKVPCEEKNSFLQQLHGSLYFAVKTTINYTSNKLDFGRVSVFEAISVLSVSQVENTHNLVDEKV